MNTGKRKPGFQTAVCLVLGVVLVLSISLMGLSPRSHPVRQEPTPRDTPTSENTWTTTPTFTPTPTITPTPGPPTATSPPTSTSAPTSPPEPTDTRGPTNTSEPTITKTPTKTPTGTPGLEPVTPIITPVWVTGVPITTAVYVGTRLPVSGVEPSPTPTLTPVATQSQTPVPTLTRPPSPTLTPTPTPSDRLGPAAPAGLVATAGNGVVILEWTPGGEPDLGGYRLYRSAAQGSGYSKMVSVDKKFSRYVDNTVTNDVTYYYVVTAFDVAGNESAFSDEVSITPSALKDIPASGATLPEVIAESQWFWMGLLTVTLVVLVGGRRQGLVFDSKREEPPDTADDVEEQGSSQDAEEANVD